MTRFAWLQSRAQTLIAATILAAIAVAAAVTGVQLAHLYSTLVAHCDTNCDFAVNQFLSHDTFMDRAFDIVARAAPPILGMFWGAPLLAREFESGTYRLVWTQGVPRSRWLATRLLVGGLVTVSMAGLLTLTITWWYRAHDKVGTNPYAAFDRRDVAPIAYALFAFAAGALLGAVLRRTVPAMAATLGVYVVALVVTSLWIRPRLLPPVHKTLSLKAAGPDAPVQLGLGSSDGGSVQLFVHGQGPPKSWTLSSHLVTNSGDLTSKAHISAFLHQYCPNVGLPPRSPADNGPGVTHVTGPDAGRMCLAKVARSFRLLVTYQPANRYWAFQWLETSMFVVLALAATLGCFWWVRRRAV